MLQAIAILSLFWPSPQPPACPPAAREVAATVLHAGHAVDLSRSRGELAAMGPASAFSGFATQGLTRTELTASFRMEVSLTQTARGEWCADAEKVAIEHGMARPASVYVAREIEQGSCTFRTVLEHELEHVAIAERAARSGAADAAREVRSVLATRFPVVAATREEAYRRAAAEMDSAVSRAAERAAATAERENAAIDTRESYEALSRACP